MLFLFSFQLLDCSSVITVFILSYIFLRAGYKLLHLGGAGVCLLGMLGLVLTDVLVGKNSNSGTGLMMKNDTIPYFPYVFGQTYLSKQYTPRSNCF